MIVLPCPAFGNPAQPSFSDLGTKVDTKLSELKENLQQTVEKVKNHVQELEKDGHDFLAEKLDQVRNKFQQLVDALENKLSGRNYDALDDISNAVDDKALEARTKLSEVSKFLKENLSRVGAKLREQLVLFLDEAERQVDRVAALADEKQAEVLEEANKFDEKVVIVKQRLHQLLDTLHEKYLELREKSKSWSSKLSEKRQNMLNKVKDMIKKVKTRLSPRSQSVGYDLDETEYELSDKLNEELTKKVERLTSRIAALESKATNMRGMALDAIKSRINRLRSLLESAQAALKGGDQSVVRVVYYDLVNYELMDTLNGPVTYGLDLSTDPLEEQISDQFDRQVTGWANELTDRITVLTDGNVFDSADVKYRIQSMKSLWKFFGDCERALITHRQKKRQERIALRDGKDPKSVARDEITAAIEHLKERLAEALQKVTTATGELKDKLIDEISEIRYDIEKNRLALMNIHDYSFSPLNYDDSKKDKYLESVKEVVKKQMEQLRVRIEQLTERIRDAEGKVKEALMNKLDALKKLVQRLEDRLAEPMVAYDTFGDIGEQVDNRVAKVSTQVRATVEELRQKIHEVITDLRSKSSEMKEFSKNRVHELLDQVRESVEGLFQSNYSSDNRAKRSLSGFGKRIDDKLSKLREALKFENLGKLTDNLSTALTKAVKNAVEVGKNVKNATVEAAQGHVDVAKKFVDQILDSVRNVE